MRNGQRQAERVVVLWKTLLVAVLLRKQEPRVASDDLDNPGLLLSQEHGL